MTTYQLQQTAWPSPAPNVLPMYLYQEYADDLNIQAFVDSYNVLAQSYLDWFADTPFGVYTNPAISGLLLDWLANGVYGIARPIISSSITTVRAGYNAFAYNAAPYNYLSYSQIGTSQIASDDIYKRCLTWILYRGDGYQFSLQWLKNRIARFLYGAGGADYPVLDDPPSITLANRTLTISLPATTVSASLAQLLANGSLPVPFNYFLNILQGGLGNDGKVLFVTSAADYPTSTSGLSVGDLWSNGGVVCVYGTTTPSGSAPPVYFSQISAASLLSLGGGNLPLSNSGLGPYQLWNNSGVVCLS